MMRAFADWAASICIGRLQLVRWIASARASGRLSQIIALVTPSAVGDLRAKERYGLAIQLTLPLWRTMLIFHIKMIDSPWFEQRIDS
jgi:hypothetical protein